MPRDNIAAALEDFLEEPLKPWERADRLIKEYELINPDPNMVYGSDDNEDNVTRMLAELLHYCAQKKIDIKVVTRKAQGLYDAECRPQK